MSDVVMPSSLLRHAGFVLRGNPVTAAAAGGLLLLIVAAVLAPAIAPTTRSPPGP